MSDAIRSVIDTEKGTMKAYLSQQASFSGDGILITTYENDYIVAGNAFQIHRRFSIPASGSLKIVFDFSSITNASIFSLPIRMNTNTGQAYVDTYTISSYTGGTVVPSINRNALSSNTAVCVVKSGITSSDVAGDDLREYIVGELTAKTNPGGGFGGGNAPKILTTNPLVIEIKNQEEEIIIFELNFNWYEA